MCVCVFARALLVCTRRQTHTAGSLKLLLCLHTSQAAKEANRRRQEAKYANATPFKLRTTERPTNLDKIKSEIEADIARQLTFQPMKANAAPPPPTTQVSVLQGLCVCLCFHSNSHSYTSMWPSSCAQHKRSSLLLPFKRTHISTHMQTHANTCSHETLNDAEYHR